MKIGILYIALGAYSVMWQEFYDSAKQYFLNKDEKHFFVFTDDKFIKESEEIRVIKTQNYGWPGNTLYRFRMFSSISEELESFDYLFFFNANALFVKNIDEDILPKDNCELVSVQHFAYENCHPAYRGYDRNRKSKAFVPWKHEPKNYCQACFIGGKTSEFLRMSSELAFNIESDEKKHICARWHDESHFNHYLMNHSVKVLPWTYSYPEIFGVDGKTIFVLMRNKERYGALSVLRTGKKRNLISFLKFKIVNQCVKIRAHFYRVFWRLLK